MVDQEDHLGVADQCLQTNIDIGAGMDPTHHQGHPEVQHVLRIQTLERILHPGVVSLIRW